MKLATKSRTKSAGFFHASLFQWAASVFARENEVHSSRQPCRPAARQFFAGVCNTGATPGEADAPAVAGAVFEFAVSALGFGRPSASKISERYPSLIKMPGRGAACPWLSRVSLWSPLTYSTRFPQPALKQISSVIQITVAVRRFL